MSLHYSAKPMIDKIYDISYINEGNMKVTYYETANGRCPVKGFLDELSYPHQTKAFAYFEMLEIAGSRLRPPYSKHLVDGIFELRPSKGGVYPRILYFFDKDERAVLTNGFLKRTQKTPSREIELALKRRAEYYERKE